MAKTDPEYADERKRLREQIRQAESSAERREAVRRLAAIDRERHQETYEKIATE